ncbi:MAG: MFS transporter [Chloroflexi bacterium]|nr:MFS transporter [Chloroflexota bacterium]
MTTDGTTEETATAATGVRGYLSRIEAVKTLQLPSFRFYLLSNLLFFFGQQMQLVARQWLLLQLTPSRTLLGMIGFAQGIAVLLLSLLAGAMTDRVARRNLLMAGQAGQMGVALIMGVLIVTGVVQIWHIIAASIVIGIFLAFTQPATQTFVFDLVGKERLMNALAVNSSATGLAQMAGPALAGLLIATVGIAGTYWVSSGGYVVALLALCAIPIAGQAGIGRRKSIWHDIREGLEQVRGNPVVLWLLGLAMITLFASAINVLRPVYAKEILQVGSKGFGLMGASFGLGAILGAITVASLGSIRRKGLILILSGLAWYSLTTIYSVSRFFPLTLGLEVMLGICSQFWTPAMMTAMQTSVSEEMRGRVMSIYFMTMQSIFLGQLLSGVMADVIGDTFTLFLSGVIPVALYLFVLIRVPAIRNLR